MRLVLDSNVVLALWVFSDPALSALRRACEAGEFVLLGNEACRVELERVLAYPEFKLGAEAAAAILAAYRARLERVPEQPGQAFPLPKCRDRDDQKFLELAREGGADYLLTRDRALLKLARKKILHGRFAILTPEKFLQAWEAER
ncbi:MAG: putative toxin-antitoxin system toxin component, PIN family [Rhodocyclaceae bacterium]|nr:putative toxin-antitoxin system toxin component, PIN family [Rhodocyclaceae bacterium]